MGGGHPQDGAKGGPVRHPGVRVLECARGTLYSRDSTGRHQEAPSR
jgi:hypothetical protein